MKTADPPRGRPADLSPDEHGRLERLDRLARLLDESIRIPGIGYRIGYDAVIGFVPGVGDIVGMLFSMYIVAEAARFRISKLTLARMIANVALEALVGMIPLAGDAFDAVYKANLRNLRLLRKRLGERKAKSIGDRIFFAAILAIPLVVTVAIAVLLLYLASLL